jgi:asparagine synthase (glutamine-hydrolysing)
MCGIAGIVSNRKVDGEVLKKMTDAIAHRGPDGEGVWINQSATVGLGHRRLSIIDVSALGAQPMEVGDRYVIVFNGEIYNYVELKELLQKKQYSFTSGTDTEVLVNMYDAFGEGCLQFLDGMFAFVIYDKTENKIFGARDRFGEKPFFYHVNEEGSLCFASEIKAIWAAGIRKEVNDSSLFNFLAFGYLQDPENPHNCFFKGINKLPAASFFTMQLPGAEMKIKRYWDIDLENRDDNITEDQAAQRIFELLSTSVSRRLRADVPIGSSLSGGIDSSIIVTLLDLLDEDKTIQRKTFSASFPGFKKDETKYQEIIIENTSVGPHFVYPDDNSFEKNYEKIVYHQDEPFGSASINIQYEVFKKAREQITTVLLDGQGADEIFAGYHGYYHAYFDELAKGGNGLLKKELNSYKDLHAENDINEKIKRGKYHGIKKLLPEQVENFFRHKFITIPHAKKALSNDFVEAYHKKIFRVQNKFETLNESLHYSLFRFGLEELLRYADRNSMAHSREVRLPFLNHELVTFAFTLPSHFKIREGWTKWILRKAFQNSVDSRIIWRKDKIGYEPPQKGWMDGNFVNDTVHGRFAKLANAGVINKKLSVSNLSSDLKWRIFNIDAYL